MSIKLCTARVIVKDELAVGFFYFRNDGQVLGIMRGEKFSDVYDSQFEFALACGLTEEEAQYLENLEPTR